MTAVTQDQWIVLLLKIGVVAGGASILGWVAVYTHYERWWKGQLGTNLVIKSAIVAGQFLFFSLSLFLSLNRLTSRVVAWFYVAFVLSVAPVMIWRSVIWIKEARRGK
jgi:hypothetical protein